MKYVEPDFYESFKCIADKCRHSCCIGWEIDIDDKSLKKYNSMSGKAGEDFKNNISLDDEPHFILAEDERCPFLTDAGLCRLISEYGENILCDICREHPRFYNVYDNREERGLGLCCEEAVRLLLSADKPFALNVYAEDNTAGTDEPELIFRDRVLELLSQRERPLTGRLRKLLEHCGAALTVFDFKYWAELFLSFEQMDKSWTELLESCLKCETEFPPEEKLNAPEYERLIAYFVYRHFVNLSYDYEIPDSLIFCILSGCFVCALDTIRGKDPEHIRLYSAEIEYSVENIGLIMEKISKTQQ